MLALLSEIQALIKQPGVWPSKTRIKNPSVLDLLRDFGWNLQLLQEFDQSQQNYITTNKIEVYYCLEFDLILLYHQAVVHNRAGIVRCISVILSGTIRYFVKIVKFTRPDMRVQNSEMTISVRPILSVRETDDMTKLMHYYTRLQQKNWNSYNESKDEIRTKNSMFVEFVVS